jgi:fructokinase
VNAAQPVPPSRQDRRSEPRPLVIGEVLFDELPDGERVLGGAPFNVAWHLQAFGLRPLLISRVGRDSQGDEVLAAMAEWGMDTSGVQRDPERPTGRVRVELQDGSPTFHILPDQAYDHIAVGPASAAAASARPGLLYHGTLVQRSEASRTTVESLASSGLAPIFMDVNLRDPWWEPTRVGASLLRARWIKLNQDELLALAVALPGVQTSADADPQVAASQLRAALGATMVVITRGAMGAVIDDGVAHVGLPEAATKLVDTVGAGDAFSAAVITGLVRGWDSGLILRRALEFASAICGVHGATTRDRALYAVFRDDWSDEG